MAKLSLFKYGHFFLALSFCVLQPGKIALWSNLPFAFFFIILLYAVFADLGFISVRRNQSTWTAYAFFAFLVWTGYRLHAVFFLVFAAIPMLQVGSIVESPHRRFIFLRFLIIFSMLSAVKYYFSGFDREFGFPFAVLATGLMITSAMVFQLLSIRKSDSEIIAKMQEQLKEKNKILSTLSHELRTPLTIIKSSTDILRDECTEAMPPNQIRFLNIISNHVHRLIDLVEEILINVKLEHVWFKSSFKSIDINLLIKETIIFMQPFLKRKNQNLIYRRPKIVSKAVADMKWIGQVMINLIHNAGKHTGEGGEIMVSLNENEQFVLVSVSDNGSGIDNKRKKAILNEEEIDFHAAGPSGDGFGLGLSIVKHIIEKHQGKVYMSTMEGLGTTFSFTLPKKKETP